MEMQPFNREPECYKAFTQEMLESLERSLYSQYKQIEKLYNAAVIDFQDSHTAYRLAVNHERNQVAWAEVRKELEMRIEYFFDLKSFKEPINSEDYIFNIRVSTAPLSIGQG